MIAAILTAIVAGAGAAGADEEADHEALRALKAVYEQAVNEDRLELLKPHLAEGFTGVMATAEPVAGYVGLEAYWRKVKAMIGAGGRYRTTLEADRSWIRGDIAVAKGTAREEILAGSGRTYRVTEPWTVVCVREGGAWKILRAHSGMDPLENEFVKAELRGIALASGGLMLAIGLAAGGFAGCLLTRSRCRTQKA